MITRLFLLLVTLTAAIGGIHFDLRKTIGSSSRRRLFYEGVGTSKEADGVYYATLRVGTPNPQAFTVIIDTGSATIAVPCKGCSCGNHNHFDVSLSETDSDTGRTYTQCYAEGSCNRGSTINDKMCLGSECTEDEMITHDFGCCTTFSSSFKEQTADGIIGMGGVSNSFIAALREKHNLLDENEFSLCLGSSAGHLDIGGYDETLNLEPIQWIDHTSVTGYYHLTFQNIVLDAGSDTSRDVNIAKSALIDSGTSFTYIPYSIHSSIKAQFDAWCAESETRCLGTHNPSSAISYDIRDSIACYAPPSGTNKNDPSWLATFPSLELKIQNHDAYICVPPEQYFFNSKQDAMCVGLFRDSQFVIGANMMVDFQYIFDSDHSRIGISRAKCDGEPICCGHCITNSRPVGPFEWCTSEWNPKTCSETCDEKPYTLTRDVVGCKSSNGFSVNESSCANSGLRPSVVYQCENCNTSSNTSTNTTESPQMTTTYAPCPTSNHTTPTYIDYGGIDSDFHSSTSFVLATSLLVLVVVASGILVVWGHKCTGNRLNSSSSTRSSSSDDGGGSGVNNTWIPVQSVDPDEEDVFGGDEGVESEL